MSHIDYALYESPVGYALFQVVHQSDAVGLKLQETQAAVGDLAKFGKMVKLVNFSPFRLVFFFFLTFLSKMARRIGVFVH